MNTDRRRKIAEWLADLEDKNGRLDPVVVEKAARSKSSPVHDLFEWDDKKAGYQFRIQQARTIIRSVVFQVEDAGPLFQPPKYVRDPAQDADKTGYVSVVQLRSEEDNARDALHAEFKRIAGNLARAHRLARVLKVEDSMSNLIESYEVTADQLGIKTELRGVQ